MSLLILRMMTKVIIANKDQHARQIRELFWGHLQWSNSKVTEKSQINLNTAAMFEADMKEAKCRKNFTDTGFSWRMIYRERRRK